jgi:HSP20 family molecular chaperone IbpA
MSNRMSLFNSPFLLGFDQFEQTLDRIAKASAEGYPPYNIEQIALTEGSEGLRITLAVAGFLESDLDIFTEDNQLVVRGKHRDDRDRVFLHRGIAARQFQRTFVLADGIEVLSASLDNGLLNIDLRRILPAAKVRQIPIGRAQARKHGITIDSDESAS